MNILKNQSLIAKRGWAPGWRLDEEPASPHYKKSCYKMLHNSSEFKGFFF